MSVIETKHRIWSDAALVLGAACISAVPLAAREEQEGNTMDPIDKLVVEKFAAFEQERDPGLLHKALEITEAAERDAPAHDLAARKRALSRWLRFFEALDRTLDPTWNPEDVPVRGVTPPESDGVVYGSGEVDPSTIPDPVVRAEYERSLKAGKDSYEHYLVQLQLQRIDERALRAVGRMLAARSSGSSADRREFEGLLGASMMNEDRRERLRALGRRRNQLARCHESHKCRSQRCIGFRHGRSTAATAQSGQWQPRAVPRGRMMQEGTA